MSVVWMPWGDDALRAAQSRGVPILLLLEAAWCRWCKQLDRIVLRDPRVENLIQHSFVPVRVDKDRRPDLDGRYSKGGWPTLAYLDDQGNALASDLYLDVPAFLQRLQLVSGYWNDNRESVRRRLAEAAEKENTQTVPGELSRSIVDWTVRHLLESADPMYGGWGKEHKFPHSEALDLVLMRWSETGDENLRTLILRTLRHVQQGEIHDRVEGGFYRYATRRDWSSPHHEKLLDSNAQRLRSFAQAHQALGEPGFADTARGVARWLESVLLDQETRAFRGSQDADPEYAHLATLPERRAHRAPATDATIFANWNARCASALFEASTVLETPRYQELALGALNFVVENLLDPSVGVYHYWDGTYHLPGLLTDQAHVLVALLDAYQYHGDPRWLTHALNLAQTIQRILASPEGGFCDAQHDLLWRAAARRASRSIQDNALAAEAFLRLAHVARQERWAQLATDTLKSFAGDYKRHGEFVASYARSVDLLLHPPVHVTIVGDRSAKSTQALHAAALAPYVASRIVQVIDPVQDAELFERSGLVEPRGSSTNWNARAFMERGRESFAETSDPARLVALMTRVE